MEDDRVPCDSFYMYCKELLDKYEFDTRVNHICGTNLLGVNEKCDADYFFAPFGSTTWATWKRVADEWDEEYSFLEDNDYFIECLKNSVGKERIESAYNTALWHKETGKQYWETILGMGGMLNNRVAIIPKRNMICDLGLTDNATHAVSNTKLLTKAQRKMFNMKTYNVSFPLKHPKYLVPDYKYVEELNRIGGVGHPLLRYGRKLAYVLKCFAYGEGNRIIKKIRGI